MRKLPCLPGALAMRARTAEQRTVYMELSNQRTRSIQYTCFTPSINKFDSNQSLCL